MDSENILNLKTIDDLKDILEDELNDLFIEFQSNTKQMIEKLRIEEKNNNIESIINIAHAVKGSSGNLGLNRIYEQTQELEKSLRSGTEIDVALSINLIEKAYEETISALIAKKLL